MNKESLVYIYDASNVNLHDEFIVNDDRQITVHGKIFSGIVKYKGFGYVLYVVNGEVHRTDGPARLPYDEDSVVDYHKEYYYNGKIYNKNEWFELLTPKEKQEAVWNFDND